MTKKIARLKATNEKIAKGNNYPCEDIFEIDIEKEFNFKNAEHEDSENFNFNLIL